MLESVALRFVGAACGSATQLRLDVKRDQDMKPTAVEVGLIYVDSPHIANVVIPVEEVLEV
jgi:hypothetical protein